jgi:hypothetical protein
MAAWVGFDLNFMLPFLYILVYLYFFSSIYYGLTHFGLEAIPCRYLNPFPYFLSLYIPFILYGFGIPTTYTLWSAGPSMQ